jgi:hypothetical protein
VAAFVETREKKIELVQSQRIGFSKVKEMPGIQNEKTRQKRK